MIPSLRDSAHRTCLQMTCRICQPRNQQPTTDQLQPLPLTWMLMSRVLRLRPQPAQKGQKVNLPHHPIKLQERVPLISLTMRRDCPSGAQKESCPVVQVGVPHHCQQVKMRRLQMLLAVQGSGFERGKLFVCRVSINQSRRHQCGDVVIA